LLSFSAESFVSQFAIQEYKGYDMQNYNFAVVMYGCESWSFTLREERRLRVFENRVLRRVFGRKKAEVTGEWRKLHNEELNDLYSSPTIFRVIKLGRMTWARHGAHIGESRDVHRVLVGNLREKDHLEDPDIDGKIILRWILRKWDVGQCIVDLFGSGEGQMAGTCKRGNEPSRSIKCGEFLV